MRISLISSDEKLRRLLAEVVGKCFLTTPPGEPVPDADLYVWDLETTSHLPAASLFSSGRHLFLLESRDLAAFEQQISQFGCILLKPVNRATLEAFLGPANEPPAEEENPGATTKTLRSERDSLLQYVLSANLKLQEYDKDRTSFLARAVHDLRAPLTALNGYCGLLLDGELGPVNSKQAELLQRMQTSSARLGTLAGNLLALSVEGHVQRTLDLEPGDIELCIGQALEDLWANLDEKHICVETQFDPPDLPIFFEQQQIEQVAMNLLQNACKFTPKRGTIRIRGYSVFWVPDAPQVDASTQVPNAYRIDIEDSGPGVDAAVSDKIFEQYASSAGSNDRSGTGLGLAICKLIVTAHGGKIWANPSKQRGSFSFVLPFEPRSLPARRGAGIDNLQVAQTLNLAASA